jgi:hypothetical protein
MKKVLWILIFITSFASISNALSVQTHQLINAYIARNNVNGFTLDSVLKNNVGLISGITESFNSEYVWQWFRDGGLFEDRPPEYLIPYRRSRNHFHNPLLPLNQAYYTDTLAFCNAADNIFAISGHCPESAILWAQGPQNSDTVLGFDLNPGGDWSWKKTRENYFTALTSKVQSDRDTMFANTFRGLGQLMHLIEDMSVPEHTRNAYHATYAYEEWVRDNQNVLTQAFSNPVFFDMATLITTPSEFGADAPVPIANLFDTNQYDGTNPQITTQYLTAINTPTGPARSDVIGLSEYTNANYVSKTTLFAAAFPFPAQSSVIVDPDTYKVVNPLSGQKKSRPYYAKIADGETGYLLAGVPFLKFEADKISEINGVMIHITEEIPIMDGNVYRGYAANLLPRAVGYSAQLLNYFFRGTLEISAPDRCLYGLIDGSSAPYTDLYDHQHQQFTTLKAKVINTSHVLNQAGDDIPEAIQNGTLQAVAKYKIRKDYLSDLSNDPPTANSIGADFSYSVSELVPLTPDLVTALNGTIPKEFAFDFGSNPIPAGITDLYFQVVFKGTLGNEADNAIAVGFKDISEPTHIDNWNTSDYVYDNGTFTISPDTERTMINAEYLSFKCTDDFNSSFDANVIYGTIEPGQFTRVITLSGPGTTVYMGAIDAEAIAGADAVYNLTSFGYTGIINQDGKYDSQFEKFRGKGYNYGYILNAPSTVVDDGYDDAPWPDVTGDAIAPQSLDW